jgi:hypothetical protein
MGGFAGMGGGGAGGVSGAPAVFSVPSEAMLIGDPPPSFNYQEYLAERRAFRAAQAVERQQRLALKKRPKSRPERRSPDLD